MSETNLEQFLFEAALQKSSAAERAAFLNQVCHNNPALRARLDVLGVALSMATDPQQRARHAHQPASARILRQLFPGWQPLGCRLV